MSWLATATKELMFPSRSNSSVARASEIGLGEGPERNGQDIELAGLDQGEQQSERTLELGDLHAGGGFGPTSLAEHHGRRRGRVGGVGSSH